MIIRKEYCQVCGNVYSNMMNHILRETDDAHKSYIEGLNLRLDPLITESDLYIVEIEDILKSKDFIISKHYIAQRIKEIEPERETRVLYSREMSENNPIFRGNVTDQIRKFEKDRWIELTYKDILNHHMEPIIRNASTDPKEITFLHMDYIRKFEDTTKCNRCQCKDVLTVNYVDEDTSNLLLSNLEVLCIPCYGDFHFNSRMQPFASVSKTMSFASAHKLPHHLGKCESWHGHEWDIEVTIKRRIDPISMMVVDFKELKTKMTSLIIDILDHNTLNDLIAIPTAENIIVWCWEQLMFKGHLKGIEKIKLWESKDSFSEITKEDMMSVLKNKVKR
jgi:6-pyruvoyltetrahydropterin/6-carboxytetrahydropterin synthase